ncbi:unnamed protein product [Protopolystoma xenopodis]|uniref:Uncharacterized protein n=1 Tax=Protopolystoma xenopodis TaxID=117903 RepID=A0A3S5A3U3_9PLAT|nr:unnamed protein product [Protopolystoma xenopodis]
MQNSTLTRSADTAEVHNVPLASLNTSTIALNMLSLKNMETQIRISGLSQKDQSQVTTATIDERVDVAWPLTCEWTRSELLMEPNLSEKAREGVRSTLGTGTSSTVEASTHDRPPASVVKVDEDGDDLVQQKGRFAFQNGDFVRLVENSKLSDRERQIVAVREARGGGQASGAVYNDQIDGQPSLVRQNRQQSPTGLEGIKEARDGYCLVARPMANRRISEDKATPSVGPFTEFKAAPVKIPRPITGKHLELVRLACQV